MTTQNFGLVRHQPKVITLRIFIPIERGVSCGRDRNDPRVAVRFRGDFRCRVDPGCRVDPRCRADSRSHARAHCRVGRRFPDDSRGPIVVDGRHASPRVTSGDRRSGHDRHASPRVTPGDRKSGHGRSVPVSGGLLDG